MLGFTLLYSSKDFKMNHFCFSAQQYFTSVLKGLHCSIFKQTSLLSAAQTFLSVMVCFFAGKHIPICYKK